MSQVNKKNRARERHILPRNVTNDVTRHIFGHRKNDKYDVTHPNLRREHGKKFS